jgi:hypothetical protein
VVVGAQWIAPKMGNFKHGRPMGCPTSSRTMPLYLATSGLGPYNNFPHSALI